jgi:hypothetical protein
MTTQISSRLAAFGMALMMNGFIVGGIAYLFDAQFLHHVGTVTLAVA